MEIQEKIIIAVYHPRNDENFLGRFMKGMSPHPRIVGFRGFEVIN
jgi:hypothetical protein